MTALEHLTVKEIAAALQVSTMQVHHLISDGALAAINVGRGEKSYWRVPRAAFDAYVEAQQAETARRFRGAAS